MVEDPGNNPKPPSDLSVKILLSDHEQCRNDIRTTEGRRGLITTSAITAEGLVLVYSFTGTNPNSLLAIAAVPVIIGATAIILVGEEIRKFSYEEHLVRLERKLAGMDEVDIPEFGFQQQRETQIDPVVGLFRYITGLVYLGLAAGILVVILYFPQEVGIQTEPIFNISANILITVVLAILYIVLAASMIYAGVRRQRYSKRLLRKP